jgi:hypothetical protein
MSTAAAAYGWMLQFAYYSSSPHHDACLHLPNWTPGFHASLDLMLQPGQAADVAALLGYVPGLELGAALKLAFDAQAEVCVCVCVCLCVCVCVCVNPPNNIAHAPHLTPSN